MNLFKGAEGGCRQNSLATCNSIQRVSRNWWDPFRFQSWEHYMVHSSITDHILKRSSFWLALAMPLKFGIVEKLLVRRTRESFPFRERRWHIWITSSSQSASADWLSDSNGRSLWPISAAYGAAATTVSTVSTVIFAFDGRFLGWSVFQAHMQLCNDEEKEWICKLMVSTRSSKVGQVFFFFFICSASLH